MRQCDALVSFWIAFGSVEDISVISHSMIGSVALRWADSLQATGSVTLALLLLLACVTAWLTNLIALPGNWICVLLCALYSWIGPEDGRIAMGLGVVLALFVLALVGEAIEFLAGALGARKAGASTKSTVYSLIGSIGGAIAGAVIGIPIPVVGSALAAIVFGGLGAAAGAMYGEWTDGRPWKENLNIGHTTFWGRTFGMFGKVLAGLAMVILVIASLTVR